MPSDRITIEARFQIQAGREEEFKDAWLTLGVANCLANEPACDILWAYQDPDDPTRFMLYEEWTSRAAFEASMSSAWRIPYAEATEHLWATPRQITIWERVATAVIADGGA